MIFGKDNVVRADCCFGKDAIRSTENFVWHLRAQIRMREFIPPSLMHDLCRGERLLKIVKARHKPSSRRKSA